MTHEFLWLFPHLLGINEPLQMYVPVMGPTTLKHSLGTPEQLIHDRILQQVVSRGFNCLNLSCAVTRIHLSRRDLRLACSALHSHVSDRRNTLPYMFDEDPT